MITMKKYLKGFTKSETTRNYELYTNKEIWLYILKKRASKRTIIYLNDDGTLMWEQFYPVGSISRPISKKEILLKPRIEKDSMPVVIICGKPAVVKGLDNNIYVSSRKRYSEGKIIFVNNCDFVKQFSK